jgi:prevent-host-death family protein
MSTYSVADAKNGLLKLIDRALEGEEVIISRHGKAVAELRSVTTGTDRRSSAAYAWLQARRKTRESMTISTVDLLNRMYEEA